MLYAYVTLYCKAESSCTIYNMYSGEAVVFFREQYILIWTIYYYHCLTIMTTEELLYLRHVISRSLHFSWPQSAITTFLVVSPLLFPQASMSFTTLYPLLT